MATATEVHYSAWMDCEGLTLIMDRTAGISGPMQSITADELAEGAGQVAELATATAWIERQGFRVVSDWRLDRNYNGLLLTAELGRIVSADEPYCNHDPAALAMIGAVQCECGVILSGGHEYVSDPR